MFVHGASVEEQFLGLANSWDIGIVPAQILYPAQALRQRGGRRHMDLDLHRPGYEAHPALVGGYTRGEVCDGVYRRLGKAPS